MIPTKLQLACIALSSVALPLTVAADEAKLLPEVLVNATKTTEPGASRLNSNDLASKRTSSSDSARLLQDEPGVSLYGAGGVSSLPAIHGLADDRVRIQVDGMDLIAACPNHMNSALSYIDPSKVGSVIVYAGITPVSVGGDSIGGTIQVKSAPPAFAGREDQAKVEGQVGAFYRSNGEANGYNLSASYVGQDLNLSYSASSARSNNYLAASGIKVAGPGTPGAPKIRRSALPTSESAISCNSPLARSIFRSKVFLTSAWTWQAMTAPSTTCATAESSDGAIWKPARTVKIPTMP